MPVNNRVVVTDRFRQVADQVHGVVREALVEAAHVAVEAARAKAEASGYQIEPITSRITATAPARSRRGWYVYVYDPDFRARFFERGTYAKKGAKRNRRQKDVEGNRGVRAVHMLKTGVHAAKPVLIERLRRDLG